MVEKIIASEMPALGPATLTAFHLNLDMLPFTCFLGEVLELGGSDQTLFINNKKKFREYLPLMLCNYGRPNKQKVQHAKK